MKRFLKTVLGFALVLAVTLPVASVAAADNSVQVDGHIGFVGASYHITYDANGGTDSFDGPDVAAGGTDTVCSLSDTGITRGGYTFTGWNTAADGGGTAHKEGDSITLNANVTLYAQWTKTAATKTSGGTTTTTSAKTGDIADLSLWTNLLCISLAAMAFLLWAVGRRKKEKHYLQES